MMKVRSAATRLVAAITWKSTTPPAVEKRPIGYQMRHARKNTAAVKARLTARCSAPAVRRFKDTKKIGPLVAARLSLQKLLLTANSGQVLRRDRRAGLAIPA